MTLDQLFEEVSALGFDDAAEYDDGFLFFARRAIRQINAEWAEERVARILLPSPKISFTLDRYVHRGGEVHFELSGAALSFTVCGKGGFTLLDGRGSEITANFDTPHGEYREFLYGGGRLTFFGEYAFSALGITAYETLVSDEKANIPISSGFETVCISAHVRDFGGITAPVTDSRGRTIDGAAVSGDTLTLPCGSPRDVIIRYQRAPILPTMDDGDREIDIPKRCEGMLPLLTAAYLWLDDDPEKAEYYMALYREESERTRRFMPMSISASYGDVTGWA